METSEEGRLLIRREEGAIPHLYKDSVGYWTIGVGHLCNKKEIEMYQGVELETEEIDTLLKKDLQKFESVINTKVHVPLEQYQFDAVVSLVFNIGGGAFSKSTLLRVLNEGDYDAAADEFLKWKNAGGKPVLLPRRRRERKLFIEGEYD